MSHEPSLPARARRAALLAGAMLLAGCATTRGAAPIAMGTGAKPAAAEALDAERPSLRPVEGSTESDRGPSAFTAWFAGDSVRIIDERRSGAAGASATARYYFEGGRLVYVERRETNPGPTTSSPADRVELRIPFDAGGSARGPHKSINDTPVVLGRDEIGAVQQRAAELLAAAQDARRSGGSAEPGRWFGYEGGLKDAEELAAVYERASRFWRKVEGRYRGARFNGTFTAFYDDAWLRRIEITYEPNEGSEARESGTGAYTYDTRGRLFYYAGEESRRSGSGRNVRTTKVQYSVAIDTRGRVGAVRKTVGRRAQPLEPAEIETLLGRESRARQAAAVARAEAGIGAGN